MSDTTTRPRPLRPPPRDEPPVPSPVTLRLCDIIRYAEDCDHYPADTMDHCTQWLVGHGRRTGQDNGFDVQDYVMASGNLFYRDGALSASRDPEDAPTRALALALTWVCGFLTCAALGVIGFLLAH